MPLLHLWAFVACGLFRVNFTFYCYSKRVVCWRIVSLSLRNRRTSANSWPTTNVYSGKRIEIRMPFVISRFSYVWPQIGLCLCAMIIRHTDHLYSTVLCLCRHLQGLHYTMLLRRWTASIYGIFAASKFEQPAFLWPPCFCYVFCNYLLWSLLFSEVWTSQNFFFKL